MSLGQLFEDFSQQTLRSHVEPGGSEDEMEELKLASFEEGYGAGWEDAVKAQSNGSKALSDSVQQALLDLDFTRTEALQSYVDATQVLFEEIVSKILPQMAEKTLPQHIAGLLRDAVRESCDLPVEIHVSPQQQIAVTSAIEDLLPKGGAVRADSSLTASQASLVLGNSEKQIDLDGLISGIQAAIDDFHSSAKKGAQHV